MSVPPGVLARFRITSPEDLGGRVNHHWTVRRGDRQFVLRRVPPDAFGDLRYELRILEALHSRGWPVARAVEEPVEIHGATWCLFERLNGEPPPDSGGEAEQRERGRLLAALHNDLADLAGYGQRPGWVEVREVVEDPALYEELRGFERRFPAAGRILRWHAERAKELFDAIETAHTRPKLVLHGDFAPWNLLYQDGKLTGILDFEASHLDVPVADFALSWRGKHDGVITGYNEVRPLTDVDWKLLVPTFWAWLLLGLAANLKAMNSGTTEPAVPEWGVRHLLRRSPLMGSESTPFLDGRS
jgi:aminoglycoside phosphotransferase (APT) family kinase protein